MEWKILNPERETYPLNILQEIMEENNLKYDKNDTREILIKNLVDYHSGTKVVYVSSEVVYDFEDVNFYLVGGINEYRTVEEFNSH